jgi:hypothetical protein
VRWQTYFACAHALSVVRNTVNPIGANVTPHIATNSRFFRDIRTSGIATSRQQLIRNRRAEATALLQSSVENVAVETDDFALYVSKSVPQRLKPSLAWLLWHG